MTLEAHVANEFESLAWTEALLGFNLSPALYADHSWLPAWFDQAGDRALRALSADLLQEQGLEAAFDWSMAQGPARLFMIGRTERHALALAVGLAAQRRVLRQVVRKPQLVALRAAFGDGFDILWLPAAEAVPHTDLPWSVPGEAFDADWAKQQVVIEGYRQLLRLVDAAGPDQHAVAGRARLCAPRGAADWALPPLTAAESARLWSALTEDLIPRWAPSWTWLF